MQTGMIHVDLNSVVSPYNRGGALFPFLLGMLLAPSRGWQNADWYDTCGLEQCSVFQFLETWS